MHPEPSSQSNIMPTAESITLSLDSCAAEVRVDGEARVKKLVEGHLDFVWRLVRRMGVPVDLADDAAQQVFVVAAGRLSDIVIGSERSFLSGTALRVASDTRRSLRRRRDSLAEPSVFDRECDPTPGPDELLDQKRAGELLDRVLDQMPDDCRTTFVLFEFEEMTAPEISHLVGVPVGTVASRLKRAREIFRASVADLESSQRRLEGAL